MSLARMAIIPLAAVALSACESQEEQQADAMEDQLEREADASAAAAGTSEAALGLTEAQLLEADLVTADGTDLGDIEQVRRDASGAVDSFLVEVEDSNPDRFVLVPLEGLTTWAEGDDTDLQTTMTAQDLAALPDETPATQPAA